MAEPIIPFQFLTTEETCQSGFSLLFEHTLLSFNDLTNVEAVGSRSILFSSIGDGRFDCFKFSMTTMTIVYTFCLLLLCMTIYS
jgi:hypothetical protein